MRIDVRSTAVAAGVAFALSAFIGIVGGVQLGVLLLRALLIGALFGAGTVGVGFLIERYLPELKNLETSNGERETGGNVDIVVDDDPLADDGIPAQLPEDGDSSEPGYVTEDPQELSEVDESDDEVGAGPAEDRDEGVTSDGEGVASFRPGIEAAEVAGPAETDEDVEDLVEADDAETLPDMGRMQDAFAAPAESEQSSGPSETDSLGGDPSIYAQAIRTALKRDEG